VSTYHPEERRMMEYKFTILGRLDGLNEYTAANRTNPHKGGKMKKDNEDTVIWSIRQQLRGLHINNPVIIKYDFYEPNKKRDLDNISSFAHKVIQDSLVKTGILKNDGWNEITGFLDQFYCDSARPRIEVTIVEVGD
jgi:Holliday junction resolvase RusA-like endonuclease